LNGKFKDYYRHVLFVIQQTGQIVEQELVFIEVIVVLISNKDKGKHF